MAEWIEKLVFSTAFALILGCQIHTDEPHSPPPPVAYTAEYQGSNDTDALMAAKQREADEAVRQMLKTYEQEDFDWVRGDAEAYR